jgi:hypothetical protein
MEVRDTLTFVALGCGACLRNTSYVRTCWYECVVIDAARLVCLFVCLSVCLQQCNTGRAMAQAVSRRPLTAEARVRSRVSPRGIYGGQSGTGTGFSPSTSVFPCPFPPRRPGVDPGSVHLGFVVDKVALGQVFPRVPLFSPVSFIPPVLHYLEK